MQSVTKSYISLLQATLSELDEDSVNELCNLCYEAVNQNKKVFICGNGGSAANALHIVNDLVYGANTERGVNAEALTANTAIMTCLANDLSYDKIFSHQLKVKASTGDILIVLSGSGNSSNIIEALSKAKELGLTSCAIVGFSGGKAKSLADIVIHCEIDDMQIAEDVQLTIGHILMRSLCSRLSSRH